MTKRLLAGLAALGLACPSAVSADATLSAAQSEAWKALKDAVVVAEGASATGRKAAWSNERLLPRYPFVQFGTIFVSADALCVDGPNLRPANPWREVCAEWAPGNSGERGPECVRTQKVYLSTPIRYQKKRCAQWSGGTGERDPVCVREEIVEAAHDLKPVVEYWAIDNNSGEGRERLAYTKPYEIPACR